MIYDINAHVDNTARDILRKLRYELVHDMERINYTFKIFRRIMNDAEKIYKIVNEFNEVQGRYLDNGRSFAKYIRMYTHFSKMAKKREKKIWQRAQSANVDVYGYPALYGIEDKEPAIVRVIPRNIKHFHVEYVYHMNTGIVTIRINDQLKTFSVSFIKRVKDIVSYDTILEINSIEVET